MKAWISPYTLCFRSPERGERNGFLLRIQNEDFEFGYADCFPWPEFGDPELAELIEMLKQDESCPLLEKSIFFAKEDGLARVQSQSLFQSSVEIKNHKLILSKTSEGELTEALEQGFKTLKMKCGRDSEKEKSFLLDVVEKWPFQLRLDFNGNWEDSWIGFINDISSRVDYLEDPVHSAQEWQGLKARTSVSLAYDQAPFDSQSIDPDFKVVKPAKQKSENSSEHRVFSSYMDHPVGQAFALWEAQKFGSPVIEHGLMSHCVYKEMDFHGEILEEGPVFSFRKGAGIGFDELLRRQEWTPLF